MVDHVSPTPAPAETSAADPRVIERLRKILALTQSPNENESASAAAMLAKFLVQHNLSVADLEQKGAKSSGVIETGIDLGKAAFRWKLDLAEEIAEHYFCVGIVSKVRKTITFVGRPDNVESLKMLYAWVVDQIKRLAAAERKQHQASTGEHIDPLRWQVNFGQGAGRRLIQRLAELQDERDAATTAMVLHHTKEISDYTEKKFNRRYDGEQTARDKEWYAGYEERQKQYEAERLELEKADAEFLARDPDAYYAEYPERHPDAVAAAEKAEAAREERNYRRRMNYVPTGRYRAAYNDEGDDQKSAAHYAGRKSADKINLSPFLTGKVGDDGKLKGGR